MKMTEFFLAQLERETETSRRVLARVPEGHNDWKPHEKSMPLGYLATLVATMPGWIAMMIDQDELDFAPPGGGARQPDASSAEELLERLEKSATQARKSLEKTTDDHLSTTWRLLARGNLISELPRHVMISEGVFSHLAHHRGQLTVYLRLNEAKVPAIYGPSADEPF
jgi:uncharacterized damage-inducible protein DinB